MTKEISIKEFGKGVKLAEDMKDFYLNVNSNMKRNIEVLKNLEKATASCRNLLNEKKCSVKFE